MMPIEHNTLAIDAGQTGIRVRHDGSRIRDYAGIRTDLDIVPQLVDVVEQFCAETRLAVETVAAGASGLTADEARADALLDGVRHLGVTAAFLAHDSITGFLGSLGPHEGAVVAAGTGVVTLGVGPAGIARVDGWGHIIGDAGGGYWIGRSALEAALRALDGRGEATTLTALLKDNFSSPEAAYVELQTNPDRVRLVASFAKQVAAHAESDDVARHIIRRAGVELALSIVTALGRAGLLDEKAPRVSWAGSLLTGVRLHTQFEAALWKLAPGVVITPPLGLPLDGVALLPSLTEDNPLRSAIYVARSPA
ncbi:hypothetical protein GCM10027022_19590 [Alpinimonas psychrophila]|uniref:N-acetylglucosamine kinase-like BadF-type ATPase n=1 Tax=Alpinimonas psychrophila TaxID=748908 RepID=A0A7W3JUF9_9MICO|nr:BadF/BadG/BcrA/BcrD ATPase family protein [Alpinimonas psychrophila]MBA8829469.1 N-acetylglucosamine kinase-like BadF-type ATPase [Alpinimonas psychrophila]